MRPQYLDQLSLERERGITIKLAPVTMIYRSNPKHEIHKLAKPIREANPKQIQNSNNQIQNSLEIRNSDLEIANSEYILNLIDTPGHVDFSYEVERTLQAVEGAILLVDASQGVEAQTLSHFYLAQKLGLNIIPVVNKIDLPTADKDKTAKELIQLLKCQTSDVLYISAKTGQGVEALLEEIVRKIPPPIGSPEKPLRALIFDSFYDSYKGVVAAVKIVDGEIKVGQAIDFVHGQEASKVVESGVFKPELSVRPKLPTGQIGYIITGIKKIEKVRVGDTILSSNVKAQMSKEKITPLPGYRKVNPLLWAEIYPVSEDFLALSEALGKLALNDASLAYSPVKSPLGAGFRLGCLGLLHLDIVCQRLEREFNQKVVIVPPQVDLHIRQKGGKKIFEEPWVKLEIVTPSQFLGKIIEEINLRRGKVIDIKNLQDRVIVSAQSPLLEVIFDFLDRLKSISAGYASLDWQILDYRPGDLVEVEILIAGEKVSALKRVIWRKKSYNEAKNMVEKLKKLLPRQMFEVKIQAMVEGRIIASEKNAALKKDVTGHLYGGDITRKRKLWEKQAMGKKKLKRLGKVDVPPEIFLKLWQR